MDGARDTAMIVPFLEEHRSQTIALVDQIFASQGLVEKLSFRLFATRWQWLFDLAGYTDVCFWVATKGGVVLGTTGLYRQRGDDDSVSWLGWFCVAPEARGQGLGSRLLEHAIAEAERAGRRQLKLYTSTHPDEATAQTIYESRGFRLIETSQPLLWRLSGVRKLIRQLELTPSGPESARRS